MHVLVVPEGDPVMINALGLEPSGPLSILLADYHLLALLCHVLIS
jgi:hypothetical protein